MTPATTLMAYSMTKTFTAVAILQLIEKGRLQIDDALDLYLPDTPYRNRGITLREMLTHTAGLPNPIPLRWVHLAEDAGTFDEQQALARILRANAKAIAPPGKKYAYSNIGYWLLGRIVERVTGLSFTDYVRAEIIARLGLSPAEMGFSIFDSSLHAKGYLARFSVVNLLKGFVTDRKYWGGYEGDWLALRSHYPDGPAFGGLLGTARAFGRFLQDQLSGASVLLGPEARQLFVSPQTTAMGRPIPMTLGWHTGRKGQPYFFKEGGGGGFHGEMRLYPEVNFASVALANSTGFRVARFLNEADAAS
jgi:D-alanyl-D-alanine carboxypeptidase